MVFDTTIQQLNWRYEALNEICCDFEFLMDESLVKMDTTSLQKAATDLSLKYSLDLNTTEMSSEIQSFKHQALS